MSKIVFWNAAKINFDKNLDFGSMETLGEFVAHEDSGEDQLVKRAQGADAVITKEIPIGADIIKELPDSVKLICEAGTGFNNVDLEAARERGIAVCNVPGYSTTGVAQLAVTYMLNFCSSMSLQQLMIDRGNFNNFSRHLMVPLFEIQEKTLGIVGFGAIGRQVARVASALKMKILVFDPMQKPEPGIDVEFVELEDIFAQVDFLTLHCPLTPQTKHLINAERLKRMKSTAYVINTSRGPLVNEAELFAALKAGEIAGAGLDVQEVEPATPDNPLFGLETVFMTPHIGWKTIESRQRLVELMAQNIASFFNGKPINVVS
ncbi:MAG: D-2-hydroxyacid dehydrogenase [Spirochaetaceae bacterium]|nr:MAG: D-2-hydroxyacid dehydrogenase [Spirochaetaceae bacterium]